MSLGWAERGFSLIELLIVVAILSILAAVVVPNVGRFLGRGQEEARRTEFHVMSTAVVTMMLESNLLNLQATAEAQWLALIEDSPIEVRDFADGAASVLYLRLREKARCTTPQNLISSVEEVLAEERMVWSRS